jgi:NADH-quinone oxidoreductase subunit L
MEAAGLYRLSAGKFYFDQVYDVLVVWPLQAAARLAGWFDRVMVDGLVDLVGAVPRAVGALLRPSQAGLIPLYALAMIVGVLVLLGTLLAS